jgi:hypothetical protein
MRCSCCDKAMTDIEIQFIPEDKSWELCSICLEIAMDAAYSQGFHRPDDMDSVHILDEDEDDFVISKPEEIYHD